jgi:hypothetical protein
MDEHIHSAAFLVLIGLALTMIVDNPLIEVSKMGPIAVLVGMSLGLPLARQVTGTQAGRGAELAAATTE